MTRNDELLHRVHEKLFCEMLCLQYMGKLLMHSTHDAFNATIGSRIILADRLYMLNRVLRKRLRSWGTRHSMFDLICREVTHRNSAQPYLRRMPLDSWHTSSPPPITVSQELAGCTSPIPLPVNCRPQH